MRWITLFTSLVVLSPASLADDALLITGGRVLNPDASAWIDGHAILVVNDRIRTIAPRHEIRTDPGIETIDAFGLHIVPGLIDLHSHLLLHPYDEASWNDQVLKEMLELRVCRAVAAARATIEAGFTTLRDLGTEGAGYADVGLKRAFTAGIVPGPRLFTATRALVATGCYGPSGFDPRWTLPKGAEEADGVEGVRKVTRSQIAAGADWIKVYADYRRRPGDPSTPTFSLGELQAIVAEASSAGLPVAAHAVTDEAIRRAVLAGVQTIEHGYGASTEILAFMRDRGVVLCPTLAASQSMARYGGWSPGEPDPPRIRRSKEMFARALESGVTIACGSDVGVFRHGDNVRELELMVEYGMSAAMALRSATTIAARVLRRDQELGQLAPGFVADVVAVRGDPLAHPSALRSPALVIQGGSVVVDRRYRKVETELVSICEDFLTRLSERDLDGISQRFTPTAIVVRDGGTSSAPRILEVSEFVTRTRDSLAKVKVFREWITAPPRVLVDGNVACVWAPYALEADDYRASGTDVFQLVKIGAEWKIVSLTYTHRAW